MRRRSFFGFALGLSACAQISGVDDLTIDRPIGGNDAGDAGGITAPQDGGAEGGALSDVVDGSPDADAAVDAAVDSGLDSGSDAATVVEKPFAFVQSAGNDILAASIDATLASPTTAGNLVVVALTQNGNRSVTVTSVSDDAPGGSSAYVSANQRALDVGCAHGPDEGNTIEIWYAKVKAGAKTVTVTMDSSHRAETWVTEFSGGRATASLDNGAVANSQPVSTIFTAPKVATSGANALVISTEVTCNSASAVKWPFTSLPFRLGNNTAYFIAATAGTYGAVWDAASGTYAASTVVFR